MEVGLLIDASGSIRSHYQDYMNVLKKIVEHFPINGSGNRFGVVTMVKDKSHVVGYSDIVTSADFVNSLKTFPEAEGNSNMASSLKTVYDELLSTSRRNVPKILIVLSDGFKGELTRDGKNAMQWADVIEGFGIKVGFLFVFKCFELLFFFN